jgi:hypothetical protein
MLGCSAWRRRKRDAASWSGPSSTRAAIPELAEVLGSDCTIDRVGEATWALIERVRAALKQVAAEH